MASQKSWFVSYVIIKSSTKPQHSSECIAVKITAALYDYGGISSYSLIILGVQFKPCLVHVLLFSTIFKGITCMMAIVLSIVVLCESVQ